MSQKFKWTIKDDNGRILVGRTVNEKVSFFRYVDMKDYERRMLIFLYAFANNIDVDNDSEHPKIKEIIDFLDFTDSDQDELCG